MPDPQLTFDEAADRLGKPVSTVRRCLIVLLTLASLAGCGGGSTVSSGPTSSENASEPTNSVNPSASPNDLTSVNCPSRGGPTGGPLSGLGATLGAFTNAHGPQDSKYPSQFGSTISGGNNDGLPTFTARCSVGGIVVSIDQNLDQTASSTAVKASLIGFGILPHDAELVSDTTPNPCEILIYRSASLASEAAANDPKGTFLVELLPSVVSPSDLEHVDSLIYDLDTSGGC